MAGSPHYSRQCLLIAGLPIASAKSPQDLFPPLVVRLCQPEVTRALMKIAGRRKADSVGFGVKQRLRRRELPASRAKNPRRHKVPGGPLADPKPRAVGGGPGGIATEGFAAGAFPSCEVRYGVSVRCPTRSASAEPPARDRTLSSPGLTARDHAGPRRTEPAFMEALTAGTAGKCRPRCDILFRLARRPSPERTSRPPGGGRSRARAMTRSGNEKICGQLHLNRRPDRWSTRYFRALLATTSRTGQMGQQNTKPRRRAAVRGLLPGSWGQGRRSGGEPWPSPRGRRCRSASPASVACGVRPTSGSGAGRSVSTTSRWERTALSRAGDTHAERFKA